MIQEAALGRRLPCLRFFVLYLGLGLQQYLSFQSNLHPTPTHPLDEFRGPLPDNARFLNPSRYNWILGFEIMAEKREILV